jgi:hypothetical protein
MHSPVQKLCIQILVPERWGRMNRLCRTGYEYPSNQNAGGDQESVEERLEWSHRQHMNRQGLHSDRTGENTATSSNLSSSSTEKQRSPNNSSQLK